MQVRRIFPRDAPPSIELGKVACFFFGLIAWIVDALHVAHVASLQLDFVLVSTFASYVRKDPRPTPGRKNEEVRPRGLPLRVEDCPPDCHQSSAVDAAWFGWDRGS